MAWTVLLLVAVCSFFVSLGLSEIVDINEGLRLMPAIEMHEKGDWVVPRIDGEVYINKPPLVYWILAATYKLAGGPNLIAARLTIALACLLTVLAIIQIGRRQITEGAGFWAGLILATGVYFHQKSQKAELDPFLMLAIVAGVYLFWLSFRREGRQRGWTTLGAGGLMGAAFMLKGPVLFPFLLAAALAVWVTLRPRWPRLLASVGGVVALTVLIAFPWCAMLVKRLGWHEVWITLNRESLERLTKSSAINSGPIYFYLEQVGMSFLPWSPLLLFWLARPFREFVRRENKPFFRFAALFTLFSFILFSLFKGKETEYLLPAFPYLALLCGTILDWLTRPDGAAEQHWRWMRGGLVTFAAAGCLALVALALPLPGVPWIRMTWMTTLPLLAGSMIAGFYCLSLMLKGRSGRVAPALACVLSFVMLMAGVDNWLKCRENGRKSAQTLAAMVARESADAKLYRFFKDRPHDLWYLRGISQRLPNLKRLPRIAAESKKPVMLLVRHKNVAALEETLKGRVEFVANPNNGKTDIILMTVKPKTPDGKAGGAAEAVSAK